MRILGVILAHLFERQAEHPLQSLSFSDTGISVMGLHYQQRLKPEPPTKANEYKHAPPQLLPPFMGDFMVNNPDKPTSIWYTASECKLICAFTLYVNTRERSPESIKKHGKCRDGHIHEMHDEMIRYLRYIFGLPWLFARLDSSGLYDYIKGSNHKPLRNLFVEVREDKYGYWSARARATFQWWVMLPTPLRERYVERSLCVGQYLFLVVNAILA